MGKLDDYLAKIKEHDAELAEQIETQYLQDLETRDETIKQLEKERVEKDEKISVYARENYDLARKLMSDDDGNQNNGQNDQPERKMSLEERISQAFRRKQ